MVLAPSYSPIISIYPFPVRHDTLPFPLYTSLFPVAYESPMLSPSEWNKQKEAERSAQLEDEDPRMILIAHCELCDIGIGPGHVEQELYLYPVYDHAVLCIVNGREQVIKKEAIMAKGGHWFVCCGGCARSKKRHLAPEYCLLDHRHWTTNLLLRHDGEDCSPIALQDFPRLWQGKDAYLRSRLAQFGLTLPWFLKKVCYTPKVQTRSVPRPNTLASLGMALVQRSPTPVYAM